MAPRRDRPGWKKEVAALACGLLLGAAWEAAHAERASVTAHAARGHRMRAAAPRALVTPGIVSWHKGA